jgi:hypothetical protein
VLTFHLEVERLKLLKETKKSNFEMKKLKLSKLKGEERDSITLWVESCPERDSRAFITRAAAYRNFKLRHGHEKRTKSGMRNFCEKLNELLGDPEEKPYIGGKQHRNVWKGWRFANSLIR